MRRYQESIEVRARADDPGDTDAMLAGTPDAFVWRGRLYVVREVLDHWQERRQWWRDALDLPGAGTDAAGPEPARDRRVWRVEASSGRSAGTGVYDLGSDGGPGRWLLLRVAD